MKQEIIITGAKTHNLKNINLRIPKNKFCVITGLSGSGKSSLAFDTLYAEGQRKYVESLSSYARQFLDLKDKPHVDSIEGLSPAISIEQKSTSHNPRSTVGTITEIYDYLRLLFARIGEAKCPKHGYVLKAQTIDQMTDEIQALPESTKIMISAPIVRNRKGEYKQLLQDMNRQSFIRAIIDDNIYDLSDPPELDLHKKHTIKIIVDRLRIKKDDECRQRLADDLEISLKLTDGIAEALPMDDNSTIKPLFFSSKYSCPECGYSISELEPRCFSFNNPAGACPTCDGLGVMEVFEPQSFIIDENKSIREGAVHGWSETATYNFSIMKALSTMYNFSLDEPFKNISPENVKHIFYGSDGKKLTLHAEFGAGGTYSQTTAFIGIIPLITKKYHEAKDYQKDEFTRYLSILPCPSCGGTRLREEYCNVFISNKSLPEICNMNIKDAFTFFSEIKLNQQQKKIAARVIKEIKDRLNFLSSVGLEYLTLNRSAETLSGGESQRIRLASQIGSGLTGVMYVLDEPSIGLHQRDNARLLESLHHLRDLGNTVIVVEHDEDTIRQADYVIDVGPGAGIHGGNIVASGTPDEIAACKDSLTGQYLSGKLKIAVPKRLQESKNYLVLEGASGNNLKNITLTIPCGLFTCITGVSGSGKSTLINDTLYPACAKILNNAYTVKAAPYKNIKGLENFDKVINIDQTPIGRTPRSNPATYIDLFTPIRNLFAETREARAKGYTPTRFSFNVRGGRCEACQGAGLIKVEMNFLPDVYVECSECHGKRYNRETLDIEYKGKNINDILNMTVDEALEFFDAIPILKKKLKTLHDVGLSYITLGQSATTFSGGEAQRIKLAKELSRVSTGKTLYILDEPTTGLHFHDIDMLLKILFRLRDAGNTVVVIEHNMDVIKCADYIVDLGPEGGNAGGQIICSGSPEKILNVKDSWTGMFLKKYIQNTKNN